MATSSAAVQAQPRKTRPSGPVTSRADRSVLRTPKTARLRDTGVAGGEVGTTTRFLHGPSGSLEEKQGSTFTAAYAYGNGLVRKDGEYPMFDGLGSVRTTCNSSQTVTATATYEGFGATIASTGSTSSPYGFAGTSGYRNDGDAGLTHVGARYYDAQVGRFASRDTKLNEHPFLYCEHDPIDWADPSGRDLIGAGEVAGGIIGIIALVPGVVVSPGVIVGGVIIGYPGLIRTAIGVGEDIGAALPDPPYMKYLPPPDWIDWRDYKQEIGAGWDDGSIPRPARGKGQVRWNDHLPRQVR